MGMGMGMGMGLGLTGAFGGPVGFILPDTLTGPEPDYDLYEKKTERKFPLVNAVRFDDRCWDGRHLAQAVLGEFSSYPWQNDQTIIPKDWQINPKFNLDQEIRILIGLGRTNRMTHGEEILAQAEDATPYWANLLMTNPVACPATWLLVHIGEAVGMMVSMYFKRMFRRPRPVQVYPALMPLLLSPPHASFPNAHALQSFLMSRLLEKVRLDVKPQLDALAMRVAVNREIAGVHYPSDRVASMGMIDGIMAIFDLLEKENPKGAYASILARAGLEWPDILVAATPQHNHHP